MELFLYYLLRVSVLMTLFYGFYKLFLAGNTFHAVNRILLFLIALTASLLPLFRFNFLPEKKTDSITEMLPMDLFSIPITESVESQPQMEIPWIQIILFFFAVGFLFAIIRYLIGLVQLYTIIHKSEKQTIEDGVVLCLTDENISPFSWMKYIVLTRKDLIDDNLAVIRHEKAHINLQHSWDMVFYDLFTCVFWFNPFSWLLRREIQSLHEFQADEKVLLSGINVIQYQLLLIRKSVGEYKFALANNFHRCDLHKRIKMMKKGKTKCIKKWNYAMSIPVLFLAMVALSVPKLNAIIVENESISTDLDKIIVEAQMVDEAGDESINQSNITVSGIVRGKEGAIAGALVTVKGSSRGTVTDMDGKFSINAETGNTLVFTMINYKTVEYKVENAERNNLTILLDPEDNKPGTIEKTSETSQDEFLLIADTVRYSQGNIIIRTPAIATSNDNSPLIIVDGKTVGNIEIQNMDVNNIESISILKDKSAIEIYGDKGMHGVVLITTKNSDWKIGEKDLGKSMDSLRNTLKELSSKKVTVKKEEIDEQSFDLLLIKRPLIIVDGERMPEKFLMNTIDPSEIKSISVLRDYHATDIYGEEAKNGVIIIEKK